MEFHRLQHQDQTFTYTDIENIFPSSATNTLLQILKRWQCVFPREQTLIQVEHGVPSLFVRFDCVISPEGVLQIYELQEGPGWVGYSGIANEKFRNIREQIVREEWPDLKVWRSDLGTDIDDDLWLERTRIEDVLTSSGPLIVRNRLPTILSGEQRATIIRRSLRPVTTHNSKRYGVELGWWKPVGWEDSSHGATLPWSEPFVLKPRFGYGSTDIMLWRSDDRTGRATQTQIKRVLEKRGTMYLQPYIHPMHMDINGNPYNFIYRPYFIYSIRRKGWVPAHGIWTARPQPNLRIHGASDSVTGPLHMES